MRSAEFRQKCDAAGLTLDCFKRLFPDCDPFVPYCCSGRDCMCGGVSTYEQWAGMELLYQAEARDA